MLTEVTPERLDTVTGVDEHASPLWQVCGPESLPMPSSPKLLSPQHSTVPPRRRAQADNSPTDSAERGGALHAALVS